MGVTRASLLFAHRDQGRHRRNRSIEQSRTHANEQIKPSSWRSRRRHRPSRRPTSPGRAARRATSPSTRTSRKKPSRRRPARPGRISRRAGHALTAATARPSSPSSWLWSCCWPPTYTWRCRTSSPAADPIRARAARAKCPSISRRRRICGPGQRPPATPRSWPRQGPLIRRRRLCPMSRCRRPFPSRACSPATTPSSR